MTRLRAENAGDYTQASVERENFEGARARGADLQRVSSGRRPTERFIDGEWVRVMDT